MAIKVGQLVRVKATNKVYTVHSTGKDIASGRMFELKRINTTTPEEDIFLVEELTTRIKGGVCA